MRRTLGAFATGVTVVTTHGAAGEHGMTANSFTSVSLDPPLVLLCIRTGSRGETVIATNGVFAVNVLAADQEALSLRFARRDRPCGHAAFHGVDHGRAATGSPILAGVAAYLDCRLTTVHSAGDHAILLGEVLAFQGDGERAPLVFHGGRYSTLTPAAAFARPSSASTRRPRPFIPRTSAERPDAASSSRARPRPTESSPSSSIAA